MTTCRRLEGRLSLLFLFFAFSPGQVFPAGDPGPGPTEPADLPQTFEAVHRALLELSWDFGDVVPPDWRKELVEDDPTANFRLRWKYEGPGFDHAVLSVYDAANALAGDVPLPLGAVAGDGFRYTTFTIGDLPADPTLTMQVRLRDEQGEQVGAASNEVQITEPLPEDPFLYTPLFMLGLARDFGVPGLGGAVYCAQPLPSESVVFDGVRRFSGGAGFIAANDRWHIGSDTKAMTATVLGKMIENGWFLPAAVPIQVSWDTPISAFFPEWGGDIHSRFNSTTLRHLACHRSGLRMTKAEDAMTRVVGGANDDPRAFRYDMTGRLMTRQHYEFDDNFDPTDEVTVPGTKFFYGSGNYLILGAIIEKARNQSYEDAMQELLFAPAALTTAAFGMPIDVAHEQPHGHRRNRDFPHELIVDNTELPPVWNPAGGVYLSLQDWIKFLRIHLGQTVGSYVLDPDTLAELHTMHPQSGDGTRYGFGWGITALPGGVYLSHDGTYGRFYARCSVDTETGTVVCVAVNQGPDEKKNAGGDVIWSDKSPINAVKALHDHLYEKAKVKASQSIPFAGSLLAGSFGRTGLLSLETPYDDSGILLDKLVGPISEQPGTLVPVSLYQLDQYNRLLAVSARAPRLLSLNKVSGRAYKIFFSSEAGASYKLWRVTNLLNPVPSQEDLVVARGSVAEFVYVPEPDAPVQYYFVGDKEP